MSDTPIGAQAREFYSSSGRHSAVETALMVPRNRKLHEVKLAKSLQASAVEAAS